MLIALALSACNRADPQVCGSLPKKPPYADPKALAAMDRSQRSSSCVERWAARLARSPRDSARDVADAAIEGCRETVRYEVAEWNKQGTVTDFDATVRDYWRRAHFIAVQTRAGNCYPDA